MRVELVGRRKRSSLRRRQLLAQYQLAGRRCHRQEQFVAVVGIDPHIVLAKIADDGQLIANAADAQIVAQHLGHGLVLKDDGDVAEIVHILHDAEVLTGALGLMLQNLQGHRRNLERPDRLAILQDALHLFEVENRTQGMTGLVEERTPSRQRGGVVGRSMRTLVGAGAALIEDLALADGARLAHHFDQPFYSIDVDEVLGVKQFGTVLAHRVEHFGQIGHGFLLADCRTRFAALGITGPDDRRFFEYDHLNPGRGCLHHVGSVRKVGTGDIVDIRSHRANHVLVPCKSPGKAVLLSKFLRVFQVAGTDSCKLDFHPVFMRYHTVDPGGIVPRETRAADGHFECSRRHVDRNLSRKPADLAVSVSHLSCRHGLESYFIQKRGAKYRKNTSRKNGWNFMRGGRGTSGAGARAKVPRTS